MAFKQTSKQRRISVLYGIRYRARLSQVLLAYLITLYSSLASSQASIDTIKQELYGNSELKTQKRISLLNDLAWEYTNSNLDSAFSYASQAYELASKSKNLYPYELSNSIGTIGIIYDLKGNKKVALSYYIRALDIKTDLSDASGIANIKTNIGALFFSQEDYTKSLPYFEEALQIERSLNDSLSQLGSLINIAIIQKNIGELKTSMDNLDEALLINHRVNDAYYYGLIYSAIGSNYLEISQLDSALYYTKLSSDYHLQVGNMLAQAISLDNQAKILMKLGELDQSHKKAQMAKQIGHKNNYYRLLTNTYETLYELHLAKQNFDSANFYKQKFQTQKDSILKKENKQIVDEIEAKFKLSEKEKEIALKNSEINAQKRKAVLFQIILFSSLLVAALLIWIIISKIRSNRKLTDKNHIIEQSLEEKEVLMREIHHRVKNNIQSIKSIVRLQQRKCTSDEARDSLETTINRINAMALVHNKLYQQNQIHTISSKVYFSELIADVFGSFGYHPKSDECKIDLCDQVFKTDVILSLGLILNELLTNCMKYAKNDKGNYSLLIKTDVQNDIFKLIVQSGEVRVDSFQRGFGSDLIEALVAKLKGEISYLSEEGFQTKIQVPIN